MKNFDKHEFDEIFRTGLARPDLSEIDEDWELMKARLQSNRGRRTPLYYTVLATSIAAVLLLVFGLLFNTGSQPGNEVVLKNIPRSPVKSLPADTSPAGENFDGLKTEVQPLINDAPSYRNYPSQQSVAAEPVITLAALEPVNDSPATASVDSSSIGLAITTAPLLTEAVNAAVSPAESMEMTGSVPGAEAAETQVDKPQGKETLSGSRFSLAINFAPDLNGVEQLQSSNVSYSIGAGLIYNISGKLAIEAGAAYGKKNYETGFSSFRPASYSLFQVKPNFVSSGFDVMDLQLNLAYTLFKKGRSSIGLGAGVSSYLMLDEQYSFTYQNSNARGLGSFNTGYQRNHFLGIANLNLSYKRNLTNNVKLSFNPFLKLPLTDLGYGNIRLRSAGVSVGLITDLGKSRK